ncbi:MAG: adenylate/guanylate cyclase domain-containing protein [Gammaproteobacteria bacterium]|nr:adenylate/guanylate cyclase domain-containing protein [Phycisphaerae bacterium]NIR92374.1 adenylate/guanylate cyclase domain-containing protein [Gammaproteobacteria bacterium]NIW96995.1 adenylate/guanylate cyclase domain-containing protein [Phycisphaerae bacterium]
MKRRLSTILAADVVEYSRLMEEDEEATVIALNACRNSIDSCISSHHGRVFGSAGDSVIAEFASAVEAVRCAVAIQQGLKGSEPDTSNQLPMQFRIGINLGDIVVAGGNLLGDGVNIAARLESLADPGGVMLSRSVFDQVKKHVDLDILDLGEQQLKNINESVQVYKIVLEKTDSSPDASPAVNHSLGITDKPSIAVLPFTNMSGDLEQEYFADGMVEEIITALSHFKWLFVIARNSSFTYKGKAVNVKQVGKDLGVRYILEGSVRKAGNTVRITGQLVDSATGAHLWADRFDGSLEDVFNLQDQVTASVVGAISPVLEQAEIDRTKHKPTESLDAYDYYLRGMSAVYQWTKEGNEEALNMFYKAIEIDPEFASAYGLAARCYSMRRFSGWMIDREAETNEAVRLARCAAKLAKDDAMALCTAGIGLAYGAGELDDGSALIDRALSLNPNLAWAWLFSGWVKVWLGEPEEAFERINQAIRLSPNDPHMFNMHAALSCAHFYSGNYEKALDMATTTLSENPNAYLLASICAASAALAGKQTEAEQSMEKLRQLTPDLRLSNLSFMFPAKRPEDLDKWVAGLKKAGLPE